MHQSLLLALSAKAQVPFWPVPMTLQNLAIMMIGMAYGSRLAAATVLLYLAEGLAGLPVFAGAGAGFAYMTGPTAGYLVGFVMAAGLIGWLAERGWDRSPVKAVAAMSLGHFLLFIPGVAWLAVLFGAEAVAAGLTPFIAATLLKTALGAALMQASWMVVARQSQDRIED
jgi:biotin transport system substrate-specific component